MSNIHVEHLQEKVMLVRGALAEGSPAAAAIALVEAARKEAERLASCPDGSHEVLGLADLSLMPRSDIELFQSADTDKLAQNIQKWSSRRMRMSPVSYNLFFKAVLYVLCQEGLRLPLMRQRSCTLAEFKGQLTADSRQRAESSPLHDAGQHQGDAQQEIEAEAGLVPVGCYLVGSDEDAVRMVGRRFLDPSAEIRKIRDTHFRSSADFDWYEPQAYELMEANALEFLKGGGRIEVVTGMNADRKFVEAVDSAGRKAAAAGPQVHIPRWHRLETWVPAMSFMILESRDDSRSEVYFGWTRDGVQAGTVFGSRDPTLVREFSRLFDSMVKASSDTTARGLLGETDGAVRVRRKQEWTRLWALVEEVERGGEDSEADIRFVTTAFVSQSTTVNVCRSLLQRGVRIQIIMMDPGNTALLEARFGLRAKGLDRDGIGPEKARLDILSQLGVFKELQDAPPKEQHGLEGKAPGKLEVYTSDRMPVGFYALSNHWVMYGIMPVTGTYEQGPLLVAESNTAYWRLLREDWDERLKDARRRQQQELPWAEPAEGAQ